MLSLCWASTSSAKSLDVARRTYRSADAQFLLFNQYQPRERIDLVYCNGVFHHIPLSGRAAVIDYIHRLLRPGGLFALWENNPWNPGARYVMSRIPFDRDAITLTPPEARGLLRGGGFQILRTDFLFIFPRMLSWLRAVEPSLSQLPFGGAIPNPLPETIKFSGHRPGEHNEHCLKVTPIGWCIMSFGSTDLTCQRIESKTVIQVWKVPPIIKGILTYVPVLNAWRQSHATSGGTDSSRYCYSVWLRHLTMLYRYGFKITGARIGELGPGDSIGIGLAALLSGANQYVGLDIVPFSAKADLETIFEELVQLYFRKEPIPDHNEFPRVRPRLDSYEFPNHLIDWDNFSSRAGERSVRSCGRV